MSLSPTLPFALSLTLLLAQCVQTALACPCIEQPLAVTYGTTPVLLRARIVDAVAGATGTIYTATVKTVYKGCGVPDSLSLVADATPCADASSCCMAAPAVNSSYVISLPDSGTEHAVTDCNFLSKFGTLPESERTFLKTRSRCCDGTCTCVNNNEVQCQFPPCAFDLAPCGSATHCVDNYCGGCVAEWFEDSDAIIPACSHSPSPSPAPVTVTVTDTAPV